MTPGDTAQLVTDAILAHDAYEHLQALEALWTAEGWKVLPRVPCGAGETPQGLTTRLGRASHTLFLGDDVPYPIVMDAPDHPVEPYAIPAHYQMLPRGASIGVVNFKSQDGDHAQMYRSWLQRRLDWKANSLHLGLRVMFHDYLINFPSIEPWIKQMRAAAGALYEERFGDADGGNTVMEQLAASSRLAVSTTSAGLSNGARTIRR
jgi:hypothetical protein